MPFGLTRGDVVGIVIGVVIGLPGFLDYVFGQQTALGILSVVIGILIVLSVFSLRWIISQPPFTLLGVEKELEFRDKDARNARHTDTRKVMANHKGITEFWFKDIGQPGSLNNVLINGDPPDLEEDRAGGNMGVGKRYPRHFEWRQQFKASLSMEILDAFPDEQEFYTHKVMDKTKRITMAVKFHRGKRFRTVRVLLGYGGASYEVIKKPNLTKAEDGSELELVVKKPKLGQEYRLEWEW